MSKTYDLLWRRAENLLGSVDAQLQAGIEGYLKKNELFEIEDAADAEFSLLMFKQMPPAIFRAFFTHYAQREELELLAEQTKAAALRRALDGEIISQERYQPLAEALLKTSAELSGDEENQRWLKPRLDTALMNLKFAAGLSTEVSEEVARALCEEE